MGSRGQVHIEDTGVTLYSHWTGHEIPEKVAEALAREERWGDAPYLARIIFQTMLDGDESSTGFGIETTMHEDRQVHINCADKEIRVTGFGEGWNGAYSFEGFVEYFDHE